MADRPGHDRRYAINADKIRRELGWAPRAGFAAALRETIRWYLNNQDWVSNVTTGDYRDWIARQYGASADRPQGDRPGGLGDAAISAHPGGVDTAAAGL